MSMVLKSTSLTKGNFGATLPAATRVWYLVDIEEGEQDAYNWSKDSSGKPVRGEKTGGKEKIIRFKFKINDPILGEAQARIVCNTRVSSNSGFVKTLKQLAPGQVGDDMIGNLDALCALANSLINKPFMLATVPNKEYNNIETAMPCPVGMLTSAPGPQPAQAAHVPGGVVAPTPTQVAFDDDDILF